MPDTTLPLDPDTIHDELESVVKLVQKHINLLNAGLPVIDADKGVHGDEYELDKRLKMMVGELMLASGKLENVARLINGEVA